MTNDPQTKEGLQVKVTFLLWVIKIQAAVLLLFIGEKAALLKLIEDLLK